MLELFCAVFYNTFTTIVLSVLHGKMFKEHLTMESKRNWRQCYLPSPTIKKAMPGKAMMETDVPPFPATWVFDNLAFIGDSKVACFIVETSDGLVLIDAMFPTDHYQELIEKSITELGLNAKDLKAVLVTHGHDDHFGKADVLREKYGCKIYMSEIDYKIAREITRVPFNLRFEVDGYIEDGQDFTFGDTTIHAVLTPGHTVGCMSFIVPVLDEGRPHNLAIWGGTGVLPTSDKQAYLASVDKFDAVCDQYEVDCEMSNHPFVDNGLERLQVIRSIKKATSNPFVIGREAYKRYEDFFRKLCLEAIERDKAQQQ